jgi:hypothetical protein
MKKRSDQKNNENKNNNNNNNNKNSIRVAERNYLVMGE